MSSRARTIRNRSTFAALRQSRRRARRGPIAVTAVAVTTTAPEVAFAIRRAVGGAVVRNRLRRVLRDELRHLDLRPGAYLVSVGAAAASTPPSELRTALRDAIAALPAEKATT